MKTIVLDGVEYALVPRDQLQFVGGDGSNAMLEAPSSFLLDFLEDNGGNTPLKVDDGLATNQERLEAIKIVVPSQVSNISKARPREYLYREKFIKKQLTPYDVTAIPIRNSSHLANNPEDPMIKADARRPKEKQLFYGPGIEFEY